MNGAVGDIGSERKFSDAHLLLLSKFMSARPLRQVSAPYWTELLGETADAAIETFLQMGWLVPAPLPEKLDYRFKATELKPFLKERGLKVSGRKLELIDRLIATGDAQIEALVAELDIHRCSAAGRTAAEKYLTLQKEKRAKAEGAVLDFLRAGDFDAASRAVADYEAGQVFRRGLGIDWKHYDVSRDTKLLNKIFAGRPTILNQLREEDWPSLRIATAMMALWGSRDAKAWLPPTFIGIAKFDSDTAARMLLFWAQNSLRVAEYQEISLSIPNWVKEFRISAIDGSCPSCRALAERGFRIEEIPELPNPECTHPYGCRCMAMPGFDG
jgi:hypothetical protein